MTLSREELLSLRGFVEAGGSLGMSVAIALVDEVVQLREELEPYEVLSVQGCPAKKHPDWLVDSEETYLCPWCQIDALAAKAEAGKALARVARHALFCRARNSPPEPCGCGLNAALAQWEATDREVGDGN